MEKYHYAKIDKQERAEKWLMPRIMPGCPIEYGTGKVLFAGETAGFLNPMGEGISAGLECGYEVAKAIEKIDLNSNLGMESVWNKGEILIMLNIRSLFIINRGF